MRNGGWWSKFWEEWKLFTDPMFLGIVSVVFLLLAGIIGAVILIAFVSGQH